jgi:antitoxin ParD1/3/4
MAQMNVSIPDKLKGWAEHRVAEGRYSSTSDYVRDLIRRDQEAEEQKQREIERLRAAWDEGLASGEAVPLADDWADRVIARGKARLRPESDAA